MSFRKYSFALFFGLFFAGFAHSKEVSWEEWAKFVNERLKKIGNDFDQLNARVSFLESSGKFPNVYSEIQWFCPNEGGYGYLTASILSSAGIQTFKGNVVLLDLGCATFRDQLKSTRSKIEKPTRFATCTKSRELGRVGDYVFVSWTLMPNGSMFLEGEETYPAEKGPACLERAKTVNL